MCLARDAGLEEVIKVIPAAEAITGRDLALITSSEWAGYQGYQGYQRPEGSDQPVNCRQSPGMQDFTVSPKPATLSQIPGRGGIRTGVNAGHPGEQMGSPGCRVFHALIAAVKIGSFGDDGPLNTGVVKSSSDLVRKTLTRRSAMCYHAYIRGIFVEEAHIMRHWLITSNSERDVLRLVEAPDVNFHGNRAHWRSVKAIQVGDRVWFRDSQRKGLAGCADVVSRLPDAPHTHDPGKYPHAIKWRVEPIYRFEPVFPDAEFKQIFRTLDDGAAGFKLLDSNDNFCQSSYCFPLCRTVADQLQREVGSTDV